MAKTEHAIFSCLPPCRPARGDTGGPWSPGYRPLQLHRPSSPPPERPPAARKAAARPRLPPLLLPSSSRLA
jgi:hypothetical protein